MTFWDSRTSWEIQLPLRNRSRLASFVKWQQSVPTLRRILEDQRGGPFISPETRSSFWIAETFSNEVLSSQTLPKLNQLPLSNALAKLQYFPISRIHNWQCNTATCFPYIAQQIILSASKFSGCLLNDKGRQFSKQILWLQPPDFSYYFLI